MSHADPHDSHGHDAHAPAAAPPPPPASKPGAVVVGFLVLLTGELLVLWQSGILGKIPAIMPEGISTYSAAVDRLFYVILGITGFFLLLTEGLLVYFCLRYRAKDGGRAVHTHGNHKLELAWTFVPGVILFGLAVFQTGVWGDIKFQGRFPDDKNALKVQVLGKQFEWHFRYAGEDGVFGTADDVTKLAELHVPVNRNVFVYLHTIDVLHSFWLPNVRLKQDLLSGQTIRQWFNCVKTGKFPVVCAELCGNGHTTMGGVLVVESEEEFQAWLRDQKKEFGEHDPLTDKQWKFWKD